MYVLHSHWQPPSGPENGGTVLFWAETSDAPEPALRRGRRAAHPKPQPHPFSASAGTVEQLLRALGQHATPAQPASATLLLPATRSGPQPSPQLPAGWTAGESELPALTPWEVPGLALPAEAAGDVLAHLPLPDEMPPELVLGTDTLFWNRAAALVLETLAQQKVLPVLAQARPAGPGQEAVYHARWLAVLDSPQDAQRLARLQHAMPPLCRAAWPGAGVRMRDGAEKAAGAAARGAGPRRAATFRDAGAAEGAPTARGLLESFIRTMADALARRWAAAVPPPRLAAGERSVAGEWLRALFSPDPNVRGSAPQLQSLSRSLQAWLRTLEVAGSGDFRVGFRLAAPAARAEPGPPEPWQLHFLIQARDDPSLLVPAAEIWNTRGAVLQRLGRRFDRPQERLLAGLGYAARLFPPVAHGLKSARPAELPLSAEQAYAFLQEAAPLLEQSGFAVLVPPWWNKRGARLGVRLRARPRAESPTVARLSFQALVEYQWELSVGNTTLTQSEFEALVALKSPLVQIRGQWVQLDPAQIEGALRFWKKHAQAGEANLLQLLQMGLDADETVGGLPVEDVSFEGWLDEWMRQLTRHEQLAELPQPRGLEGQLRPYQRYGYSWLAFLRQYGLGACLADDMGLGKTVEMLALLLRDKEEGEAHAPVLLICPTSVVGNWRREAEKFAPGLSVWIHQGGERLQGDALSDESRRHDLVITSYALARRDADSLGALQWRGVVLDEAQNIKNPEARQTQAIRSLPAGFRVALTGTPVENRLSELWSIMHFLNPGYLGAREAFRRNFAVPVERYADPAATQRLKRLVGPLILRRVKTDPRVIQDLPEKLEMKVYCTLSAEQASLYAATVQESLEQVDQAEGVSRRGEVLAMLMKLKQITDHPALYLHQTGPHAYGEQDLAGRSGKLDRLTEMLEEALASGDRALVFTQFAEMGAVLQAYLQDRLGRPVLFLHGGTPPHQRDQMVERFQAAGGPPVFILSLKAGGTGLNLMAANHVFHFDRWWNPAVEEQATDRAYRIGQVRNVQVHKLISLGTLEEMIDDLIESKRALAQSVVGAGENWLTELSTDDLRRLVTLRQDVAPG